MKKILVGLAAILVVSTASAQRSRPEPVRPRVEPKVESTEISARKKLEKESTQSGRNAMSSAVRNEAEKLLVDAAKEMTDIVTKKDIILTYENAISKITEADKKTSATMLVDLVGKYGKAGDKEGLQFIVKVMDLASRPEVGANNSKWKDLITELAWNIHLKSDVSLAVKEIESKPEFKNTRRCRKS